MRTNTNIESLLIFLPGVPRNPSYVAGVAHVPAESPMTILRVLKAMARNAHGNIFPCSTFDRELTWEECMKRFDNRITLFYNDGFGTTHLSYVEYPTIETAEEVFNG